MMRLILYPFSFIYGLVMAVRNRLFDYGVFKSTTFDVPIISVGNITVGGTGKTPHSEYLLQLLGEKFSVAVLSRGYGRKTKGFLEVTESSTPSSCGDEPCQIKGKFPSHTVAVCEDRCEGIRRLLALKNFDVIVLDDAFQHRWVKPGLSILLMDHQRPLYKDAVIPSGRMREFASGVKRADVVIVTKCASLIPEKERNMIKKKLRLEKQELFFSSFSYGVLKPIFKNGVDIGQEFPIVDILLLTGIANPLPLKNHLIENGAKVELLSFPDHHQFSQKDINLLAKQFVIIKSKDKIIITTEKDAMRLQSGLDIPEDIMKCMYFIPIKVKIQDNELVFRNKIINYVTENKRSC